MVHLIIFLLFSPKEVVGNFQFSGLFEVFCNISFTIGEKFFFGGSLNATTVSFKFFISEIY
jgi:hypothetical protein